jgi:hypothetical protein
MQYRITPNGPGKGGRRTGAGRPAHSATLALAFLGRGRPSRDKAKATLRAVGRDVALALAALDDLVRFTRETGPLGFQYFTANADAAAVRLRRLVAAIERGEK